MESKITFKDSTNSLPRVHVCESHSWLTPKNTYIIQKTCWEQNMCCKPRYTGLLVVTPIRRTRGTLVAWGMDWSMSWDGLLTLLRGSPPGKSPNEQHRSVGSGEYTERWGWVEGGKDHRWWGGTQVAIAPSTNAGLQIIVLGMMELICLLRGEESW